MKKRLNILLVEDNLSDADLIIRHFSRSEFDVSCKRVETAAEMKAALKEEPWDIIVSDYSLPQFNAMDALKVLQETQADIPFIVSSGTIGEQTAVELMKAGAQDYIMKDKLTRLMPAIKRELNDAKIRYEHKMAEKVQRILYNISNAVVVTESFNDLMEVIRVQLGTVVDTTNFYIAFFDEKTGLLSTSYIIDEKEHFETWPAKGSLTGKVVEGKRPLLVNRENILEMHGRGEIEIVGPEAQCWLGVPLHEGDKVIGAFVVQSYSNPHAYTNKDVDILEFISHQVSLAVHRKKTEKNLQTALLKAEESDRMKSAFLANMSHEIRTPMNAIIGFSGMLDDPSNDKETHDKYMRIINENCQQLLNIIDDLVDISKIEIGEITLDMTDVCLNKMMDSIYESYHSRTTIKDLSLNLEKGLDEPLCCVSVDQGKLRQILDNLLTNAVKFTSSGGVHFGYSLKENELEFFVRDTGIGIEPEYHESIFDRFFKVEKHKYSVFRGTGLGLAITKAFVNKFGGEIIVNSVPGEGSEFRFTMPYLPVKSDKTVIPEIEKPADGKNQITLLVVEDEEDNYHLLEILLRKRDFGILHAWTGKEALDLFENHPEIRLVLMDFKLPDISGEEVTRYIHSKKPELPIIAQTAYALAGDRERITQIGCIDYISKPIRRDEFYRVLGKYL